MYPIFFRIFFIFFLNLHTRFTPSHTAVQWEPAPTQVARASGKWNSRPNNRILVIVARRAFSFKRVRIFERLHRTWYATIWNLKDIIRIRSESRKHYLSSDTGFRPQNVRQKGENIVY